MILRVLLPSPKFTLTILDVDLYIFCCCKKMKNIWLCFNNTFQQTALNTLFIDFSILLRVVLISKRTL